MLWLVHRHCCVACRSSVTALTLQRPWIRRTLHVIRRVVHTDSESVKPLESAEPLNLLKQSPQQLVAEDADVVAPRFTDSYRPIPLSCVQRAFLAAGSSVLALLNTHRGDLVATLGETTGEFTLQKNLEKLKSTEEGRQILQEQPQVTPETVDLGVLHCLPSNTFGYAYAQFMGDRGITSATRTSVRFVSDPELAYVMLRFRQVHDFWHVLLGLPTTVLGELAQKWFEMLQTKLPVTALSAMAGPVRLSFSDNTALHTTYVPWAIKCHSQCAYLLGVHYEHYFERDLDELRAELGIVAAPQHPSRSVQDGTNDTRERNCDPSSSSFSFSSLRPPAAVEQVLDQVGSAVAGILPRGFIEHLPKGTPLDALFERQPPRGPHGNVGGADAHRRFNTVQQYLDIVHNQGQTDRVPDFVAECAEFQMADDIVFNNRDDLMRFVTNFRAQWVQVSASPRLLGVDKVDPRTLLVKVEYRSKCDAKAEWMLVSSSVTRWTIDDDSGLIVQYSTVPEGKSS